MSGQLVLLLLLHLADGRAVYVNPRAIVTVRAAGAHVTDKAKCLLNLTDGYISVVEPCDAVRRLIEQQDR
jgi:hypothetical protein